MQDLSLKYFLKYKYLVYLDRNLQVYRERITLPVGKGELLSVVFFYKKWRNTELSIRPKQQESRMHSVTFLYKSSSLEFKLLC